MERENYQPSPQKDWEEYKKIKRGHYSNPESDWKSLYDGYFTGEDVLKTYDYLVQAGIIPDPKDKFIFLSPSSNIPTQERIIYEKDKRTRTGESVFLIGDWVMSSLNNKNKEFYKEINDLSDFHVFEWDAEHIPVQKGSVDLIWEIKGWLWHVTNENNREGVRQKFLETMNTYYELLKSGGSLIIDNIPDVDKDVRGYTPSTVLKINELDEKIGGIWQEMRKKFEVFDIGEGKSKLKVFKKEQTPNEQLGK